MRDVALWLVVPLGIALLALTLVHLRSLRLLAAAERVSSEGDGCPMRVGDGSDKAPPA